MDALHAVDSGGDNIGHHKTYIQHKIIFAHVNKCMSKLKAAIWAFSRQYGEAPLADFTILCIMDVWVEDKKMNICCTLLRLKGPDLIPTISLVYV